MDKKKAIITGASSGIGLEIAKLMIKEDFLIYGISRNPERGGIKNQYFIPLKCDLADHEALILCAKYLHQKINSLDVLINNAGAGFFTFHENLEPETIRYMVSLNFTAPMILTSILLPSLIKAKGHIINIASVTALQPSPLKAVYSATKAGLIHFSNSLFEEIRKKGVKCATIIPGITKTHFFDNMDFIPAADSQAYITPLCIAKAVKTVLEQRKGTMITELVIQPQISSMKKKNH